MVPLLLFETFTCQRDQSRNANLDLMKQTISESEHSFTALYISLWERSGLPFSLLSTCGEKDVNTTGEVSMVSKFLSIFFHLWEIARISLFLDRMYQHYKESQLCLS